MTTTWHEEFLALYSYVARTRGLGEVKDAITRLTEIPDRSPVEEIELSVAQRVAQS